MIKLSDNPVPHMNNESIKGINGTDKKMIIGGIIVSIFALEHAGRYYDIVPRPSVLIGFLANKSENLFKFGGQIIAKLSSFLTRIDIDDLLVTVQSIMSPVMRLIGSPWNFLRGYYKTAVEYVGRSGLVYVGSFLLVSLISYLIYRFIPKSRNIIPIITEYIRKPKILAMGSGGTIVSGFCYLFYKFALSAGTDAS